MTFAPYEKTDEPLYALDGEKQITQHLLGCSNFVSDSFAYVREDGLVEVYPTDMRKYIVNLLDEILPDNEVTNLDTLVKRILKLKKDYSLA